MIKAVAGGGGADARCPQRRLLSPSLHAARMEADKAFGNGDVYIEKLIVNPHHIEFQIVADKHGHVVHLGERDCSIQRRNQKVIEECPSPLMTEGLRKENGTRLREIGAIGRLSKCRQRWSFWSITPVTSISWK